MGEQPSLRAPGPGRRSPPGRGGGSQAPGPAASPALLSPAVSPAPSAPSRAHVCQTQRARPGSRRAAHGPGSAAATNTRFSSLKKPKKKNQTTNPKTAPMPSRRSAHAPGPAPGSCGPRRPSGPAGGEGLSRRALRRVHAFSLGAGASLLRPPSSATSSPRGEPGSGCRGSWAAPQPRRSDTCAADMPGRAPAGGAAAGAAEARSPRRGKGNPPPLLAAPPRSRCQRPPAGPSAAGSLLPCGRWLPRGATRRARDSDSHRDPPGPPPPPAEGRAALRARCLGRPGPARAGEGPGALPCAVTSRGREAFQGLSDVSALQASPAPARRCGWGEREGERVSVVRRRLRGAQPRERVQQAHGNMLEVPAARESRII